MGYKTGYRRSASHPTQEEVEVKHEFSGITTVTPRDRIEIALSDAAIAADLDLDDNTWDVLAVTFARSFRRLAQQADE